MYSQHSYQDKLGTCTRTIYSDGCFITSICNLFEYFKFKKITPPEMNKLCKDKAFYVSGCSLVAPSVASYFGLTYSRTTVKPTKVCVAETDHFAKKGFPQHFFVLDPNTNRRIDPLDASPNWEANDYHVVSYRVFGLTMPVDPVNVTTPPPIEVVSGDEVVYSPQPVKEDEVIYNVPVTVETPQNAEKPSNDAIQDEVQVENLFKRFITWFINLFYVK